MYSAFKDAFLYEITSIRNSVYKILLISLLPLLSFFLIIVIFHSGVARDLPIAAVDNDRSNLSRMVLHNIDASPTIDIRYKVNSPKEAIDLVKSSKAYAAIIIPRHFEKDTLLQKSPRITAMLNTQYILVGKILHSALSTTVMHSSAQVEYVKKLADLRNSDAALHAVSPIDIQVTPFFNTYQNYYYFLVSALLPTIWQIFIVIATIVAVGSLFKAGKEKDFFHESSIIPAKLLGMMLPYTIIYMLIGILYTLYLYSEWSFQGSFFTLFFGMFLTLVAYQFVALFLFATSFDYARSMSMGAVYSAPAFAFLGITFPAYNMNGFALFWRDILPVTHYTQLQLSQANYGLSFWQESDKLITLLLFWLVFIPVILLFRKKLKKVRS